MHYTWLHFALLCFYALFISDPRVSSNTHFTKQNFAHKDEHYTVSWMSEWNIYYISKIPEIPISAPRGRVQKRESFGVLCALGPDPSPSLNAANHVPKNLHFWVRIDSFLYELDFTPGPNNTHHYIFQNSNVYVWPEIEFVKCFTLVRFPKFSTIPKKLGMFDVLLIYFEQFVSLFANFYSNTKSLHLFCEKSSLNFTKRVDCSR